MESPRVSRDQIDFPLLYWTPRTYIESSKEKKATIGRHAPCFHKLCPWPHTRWCFSPPGHTHVDVFFSTKVERTSANVISMKFVHGALTNQLWLKVSQNLNSSCCVWNLPTAFFQKSLNLWEVVVYSYLSISAVEWSCRTTGLGVGQSELILLWNQRKKTRSNQ